MEKKELTPDVYPLTLNAEPLPPRRRREPAMAAGGDAPSVQLLEQKGWCG
ncbi:hypothetical protein [Mesorhizobium norvegicum]|nr:MULTISPECIES: hypothetical protein [Mesorhizobium]